MKILFSVCKVLIFALLCSLATSCGSDNDDAPDNGGGQSCIKRLTSLRSNTMTLSNFSYDKEGRVTDFNQVSNGTTRKYSLAYSNSSIILKEDGETDVVYTLKGGLITQADFGESEYYNFAYGDNKLKSITYLYEDDDPDIYHFTWSNGNVTSFESYGSDSYKYTALPCITPIIYYPVIVDTPYTTFETVDLFLATYGYFGDLLTNNLVSKSDDSTMEYQLDNDNYVTKMTVKSNSGTTTIEYTWE